MLQGVCHVSDGFLGSGHAPSNNSSAIGTSHALPSAYCRDHAVYDLYHGSVTPTLPDHGEKHTVPSIEPTTLDPAIRLGEVIHAQLGREGTPLTMSAAGFRHAG